jgi:2'-5' RNA ligase
VAELRLAHDSSAALGVPAHITILFPFAPAAEVDEDELGTLLGAQAAFDFELVSVEHWGDDVTYLAPRPAAPFVALTDAVQARWPDYPPYEGMHDEPIPHLTVGELRLGSPGELAAAERAVQEQLPISTRVDRAVLLAGRGKADSWRQVETFELGS